jgi:dTDP-4-dehydrorhamnose reductase
MKVLILGSNGMLGYALRKVFKNAVCPSKKELDITNKNRVIKKLSQIKPEFVINAAAYTNVEGCEKNKSIAFKTNSEAVKYLAEACKKSGSVLVHISTDYVFDGKSKTGYKENSKKNPINTYGKSKAKGEYYIIKLLKKFYIIRTSWLFGLNGKNFVNKIIEFGKRQNVLDVVNDQEGCPTYTKDLAVIIKKIIIDKKPYGIYHVTNKGTCTWFDFARKIKKYTGLKARINPTKSDKIKRLAKRPKNSVLINTKLNYEIRNWQAALKHYVKSMH